MPKPTPTEGQVAARAPARIAAPLVLPAPDAQRSWRPRKWARNQTAAQRIEKTRRQPESVHGRSGVADGVPCAGVSSKLQPHSHRLVPAMTTRGEQPFQNENRRQ